jgi:Zn-dependent protease with chaperone function
LLVAGNEAYSRPNRLSALAGWRLEIILNIFSTLTCLVRFFRTSGAILVIASGVIAAEPALATPANLPAASDHDELLDVIQHSTVRYRFPGDMIFLSDLYGPDPGKADFTRKLTSISHRLDMEAPDVLIVNPPMSEGKPAPQKPDAGIGWANNISGKNHYLIFVTRYLREHLTDGELLAVIAHEMKHFRQLRPGFQKSGSTRKMEAEADAFALSCPEVDPHDFRSMLLIVEKLQDSVSRRHPLLYGDFTGLSAVIPLSIQTKAAFGGNHPSTGSRIKEADKEIARRAARAENAPPDRAIAAE